ncbi:MAG: hypothetical protein C5B53_12095 [Candidatus Melainabacteria bacterium]|nr:MAG: hypothetical protein C5B53_12095 [Candidatus Melainabacteria bacterium]
MPKVSVLSPTYNHEAYVREAINSVLSQTFADFELIVGDDCSPDGTADQVRQLSDPRLTFFANERNEGASATWKKCFLRSKGEYLCWFATDDVYEPHFLSTFVKYLDEHREALGVFALSRYIDAESKLTGESWTDIGVGQDRFALLRQLFLLQHPICAPVGMIRRSVFERLGDFPPYLRQANDMLFFIKALFQGEMPILGDYLLKYRWNPSGENVSARTEANDSRLDYELFELLHAYSESITSPELLKQIFPEVEDQGWVLNANTVKFHLAQLAIRFNYPSHRLFGLHLLYQLLQDTDTANYLREACNFSFADFFKLSGEYPVLVNHALYGEVLYLRGQVGELRAKLEAIELQKVSL